MLNQAHTPTSFAVLTALKRSSNAVSPPVLSGWSCAGQVELCHHALCVHTTLHIMSGLGGWTTCPPGETCGGTLCESRRASPRGQRPECRNDHQVGAGAEVAVGAEVEGNEHVRFRRCYPQLSLAGGRPQFSRAGGCPQFSRAGGCHSHVRRSHSTFLGRLPRKCQRLRTAPATRVPSAMNLRRGP